MLRNGLIVYDFSDMRCYTHLVEVVVSEVEIYQVDAHQVSRWRCDLHGTAAGGGVLMRVSGGRDEALTISQPLARANVRPVYHCV